MSYSTPSQAFFLRDPTVVARELIGAKLIHLLPDGTLVGGIIVETEAYLAQKDLASHNQRGQTAATRALFMDAGTIYIHPMRAYFGMDIVTEAIGVPSSVLIRALEPMDGIDRMMRLRELKKGDARANLHTLANGPGKLCQALGIDKRFYGTDILAASSPLKIKVSSPRLSSEFISTSCRIGIRKDAHLPLRFFMCNNKFVSR